MKIFANLYNQTVVLLLLLLCIGCSGGAKPGEESSTPLSTEPSSSARFDPLELPQDTRIVPQLQPHKGAIAGTAVTSNTDTVTTNQIKLPPDNPAKPQIDTLSNQSFRIQLHATELFGEAKREARIAEEVFDQPVFLDYEVPYYKVRVGSFSDRKDAEAYLQKAKTAGYQNAWVVAVRVNVKEVQPMYNDLPVPKSDSAKGK